MTVGERHRFYRPPELPGWEIRCGSGGGIAYGLHTHATWSLGLVLHGRTVYRCGRHHYAARTGSVMLMPPDTPHACNPYGGQPWHYMMCYIPPEVFRQAVGSGVPALADGAPWRSRRLVAAMLALLRSVRQADGRAEVCWQALAAALKREAAQAMPQCAPWRGLIDILEASNPAIQDADAWAQAAGLSRRQLSRRLEASGMSPHQWLLSRRIAQAQAAIARGAPLAQAAQDFGFADQAHFQRRFKRSLAVTPGRYSQHQPDAQQQEHTQ
ncbi:AraC family transcriptional regulator [Neisseria shayeganii 871]|uniref:AraC family transcriptional regulator n=1 Tax=Neisseria shayeganii 871 TaxID=1032488 RepID=G4CEN9_9NEIS|nr:AraC family transcriptional regulator [Neisseria shayeganii 871]